MPGRKEHFLLNPVEEPLYSEVANALAEALAEAANTSSINSDELAVLTGDAFSLFYMPWPVVKRKQLKSRLLEAARKAALYFTATTEYRVAHERTVFNIPRSLVWAAAFAKYVLETMEHNVSVDRAARVVARSLKLSAKRLEEAAAELAEIYEILKREQRKTEEKRGTAIVTGKEARGGLPAPVAGKAGAPLERAAKIAVMLVSNEMARKIVVLGGRIEARFRWYRSTRRESRRGTVNGYTLTSNPARALPREHALPDELWLAKLASGKWLAKRRMEEKLGMLIIAIDRSGSMSGDKTIWARSVAYALVKLAAKRRQPIALYFFDYNVHNIVTSYDEAIEALLTVTSEGGTCIDCAIAHGLKLLQRYRDRTNTIVIITDGEDVVRLKPEELRRHGARLIAVMIQGHNESLKRLAEESGGKYLSARLTEDEALEVVDAAL